NLSPNKERYFTRFVISENRWEKLVMLPYNENPNTTESDGVDDGGSMVWDGGDYLYVLKGGDGNGDNAADNFWRYSIISNSWEVLTGVPFGPSKNNGKRLGYAGENVYYWHANSTGFLVYAPPRYREIGYFTSSVFDAGTIATWQQISWDRSEPLGALDKKRLVSAEPVNLIDDRGGAILADVLVDAIPTTRADVILQWIFLDQSKVVKQTMNGGFFWVNFIHQNSSAYRFHGKRC
ncbi:unnamed protein product, partial [marine sediment metagenome]